jgi:K+-transporting ATPase ATPase A chain
MLILAASILLFSAGGIAVHFAKNAWINPPGPGTANLTNNGPHGLSEMLYAFTSATGNNGSAFGGFSPNTPFFNTTMGLAMLIGRFLMMIPLLAAAGSLAQKKMVPVSAGTFPTHGALFVGWLVAVILIVGALTFFPALSLGPIVEHFLMHEGKLFSLVLAGFWS